MKKKALFRNLIIVSVVLCVLCGFVSCKSSAVKNAENAIAAIGEVTEESFGAIENAKRIYNALTQEDQLQVSNYAVLLDATVKYDAIIVERNIQKAISDTVDAINSIGKVTINSFGTIENAKKQYNALAEDSKLKVSNYSVLLDAIVEYERVLADEALAKAIADAIKAIDDIGVVTEDSFGAIENAKKQYNALSETSKLKVSNYPVLLNAIIRYDEVLEEILIQKTVADAIKAIEDIGVVTENSLGAIENAKKQYNALSETAKLKVWNYSNLVNAEIKYKEIQEELKLQKTITDAIAAIDAIGEVTENSLGAIEDAKRQFAALPEKAKLKVSNYTKLVDAANKFEEILEDIQLQKAVSDTIEAINSIGTVTEGSYGVIEYAKALYNALPKNYQLKVKNYPELLDASKKYNEDLQSEKEINETIEAINAIGKVSEDSYGAIEYAKKMYNSLSSNSQLKVKNYSTLVDANKKYNELKVQSVITAIDAIGKKITKDSYGVIQNARTLYEALPSEYKSKVTNYAVLLDAEKQYAKKINNSAIWMGVLTGLL